MFIPTRVLYASTLSLLLLGMGLQGPPAAGADDANPLPRYRLEVGQELAYKGDSQFHYGNGPSTNSLVQKSAWTVWVVRKNEDGSYRLVIRSPDSTLAYCDVSGDGRIVSNASLGYRLDPATLFPRLPDEARQASKGWEDIRERDDSRSSFQVVSRPEAGRGTWTLREVRTSPMDEIYLSTQHSTATFDPDRGVIGKVDSESTQGYGINGKGTGTVELVSVERHDAEWTERLRGEADRYFEANRTYEEKLKRASKDAGSSKKWLDEAKGLLAAAREGITLPIVKEQLDARLKKHDQMASYYAEEASRRAEILGRPSASWEVKDLEGKTHTLDGYRGKVVILDFWYRGCGWCIRAMPQVKQLADDFRDQPVAVLGMNTDQVEADAKFVVEKMGLAYPTLKAEGLPEKYGVRGFPTLVIIDQQGKVHDLHVGYSPTLRQEVGEEVRKLLRKE
jgi:thiol-disulfide isomerase/thioredoxin